MKIAGYIFGLLFFTFSLQGISEENGQRQEAQTVNLSGDLGQYSWITDLADKIKDTIDKALEGAKNLGGQIFEKGGQIVVVVSGKVIPASQVAGQVTLQELLKAMPADLAQAVNKALADAGRNDQTAACNDAQQIVELIGKYPEVLMKALLSVAELPSEIWDLAVKGAGLTAWGSCTLTNHIIEIQAKQ